MDYHCFIREIGTSIWDSGIAKTETAKSVLKKIYSMSCDVTGVYQIAWVTYINGKLKDSLIEAFIDTKGIQTGRRHGNIYTM